MTTFEIADETRRLFKRIVNYNLHVTVHGDCFTTSGYTFDVDGDTYLLVKGETILMADRNYKNVVCHLVNLIVTERMKGKLEEYKSLK